MQLSCRSSLLVAGTLAVVGQFAVAVPSAAQLPLTYRPASSLDNGPFTPQFDKYINDLLDEWKVAGLAIGIVDGKESYTKAYGLAQLPDVKATTDTLWYVGSTTKAQLTATLAQIIDNQTYPALARGWQTPISSIIRDDFVLQDEWATAHLTLEDAASHRTGMGGYSDAYPNMINGTVASSRDITRLLRHFPLSYEPRTKWDYNNYMYTMLSHLVETLTGEPLRHTIKRVLWEPLGMTSTFLNLKDVNRSVHKVARGYFWDREQKKFGEYPLWDAPGISAAGTELSTVKDYTKWLSCLLYQEPPLSKAAHAEIRTPRMIERPFPADGFDISLYGLAWFRTTLHGHVVYQHTGSIDSHGANVVWLPELKYGLIIFLNQPNEVRHVIARKLMEDRIGTPEAGRFDVSTQLLAGQEKGLDDAVNMLFPDRPSPALPATHKLDSVAGWYYHPGYGAIEFRLMTDPKNKAEEILVADRNGMGFPVQWRLEHVSGDNWICWRYGYVNTARPSGAYAAKMVTAVSGGVESFNLKMPEEVPGRAPNWIIFTRAA